MNNATIEYLIRLAKMGLENAQEDKKEFPNNKVFRGFEDFWNKVIGDLEKQKKKTSDNT